VRNAACERETKETAVAVTLALDFPSPPRIETGLPMLDHLVAQWAFHSQCSATIDARSRDAIVHHLVEDAAIVLGQALDRAMGERTGIRRYGSATLPMDDALARVAVDFGGRAYSRIALNVQSESVEGLAAGLIAHFIASFTQNARIAVHADVLAGTDPHHCVEAVFKALGRACRSAWTIDAAQPLAVASTKGVF
jgi:imidazoleglycerol-phosphate dehydratase